MRIEEEQEVDRQLDAMAEKARRAAAARAKRDADFAAARAGAVIKAELRSAPRQPTWVTVTSTIDLDGDFTKIKTAIESAERGARRAAVIKANATLEKTVNARKIKRPRTSSPRRGRPNQPIAKNLVWGAGKVGTNQAAVAIGAAGLKQIPHWRVVELGTKQNAMQRRGQPGTGKAGRPRNDRLGEQQIRIPSQKGRVLKFGLGFGVSPGGKYFAPSSSRLGKDAVHRLSELDVDVRPSRIQIRREIQGTHMVRISGAAGFREYQEQVLAASKASVGAIRPRRK
jgi:hypothetical protein